MAWVTTTELKQAVADALKRDVADLPAYVDRVVAQAVEKATGQVGGALAGRGFTDAQVQAWPRLHEFSFDQALFNAEVYLREAFKDAAGQLLMLKDRTAELAAVTVTDAGGVPIDGGAARGGQMDFRAAFDAALESGPWPYGRGGIV